MSEQASLKSKSKINRLRLVVILCKPIGVKKDFKAHSRSHLQGLANSIRHSQIAPAHQQRRLVFLRDPTK